MMGIQGNLAWPNKQVATRNSKAQCQAQKQKQKRDKCVSKPKLHIGTRTKARVIHNNTRFTREAQIKIQV